MGLLGLGRSGSRASGSRDFGCKSESETACLGFMVVLATALRCRFMSEGRQLDFQVLMAVDSVITTGGARTTAVSDSAAKNHSCEASSRCLLWHLCLSGPAQAEYEQASGAVERRPLATAVAELAEAVQFILSSSI